MTTDTRTDAERRYDAERSGELYFAPAAPYDDDYLIHLLEQQERGQLDPAADDDAILLPIPVGLVDAVLAYIAALDADAQAAIYFDARSQLLGDEPEARP
jgi:hypothetical protein